ncbi:DUF5316 domain-containing protein [Chengkuizengella axinellae]|uniref:DUF5316 domain-containing protein n=1 Tax=Chengkuizengella axinellae TaxID=3064388 RepID=A0ABT9J185_9BACL|nr:DUF5316 domain-containing protein [Chengkuizengella sp. 2205SS18-9]MDP5275379.1 DUF5316 domain-containing protein [Chengkuizengella sp. 2205SS18-9]
MLKVMFNGILKPLIYGVIILFVTLVVSLMTGTINSFGSITSIVAIVFIVLAVITSGSAVSGDRMRANFAYETKEDRYSRMRWSKNLFLMSIPSLIVGVISLV